MTLRNVRAEDGNTLILMPFAVLVLLALGGIALDAAVAFRAQRTTVDTATALADDVAARIDPVVFARDGLVVIDPVAAGQLLDDAARRAVTDPGCAPGADPAAGVPCLVCTSAITSTGDAVDVTCSGEVRPIIMPALGGLTTIDVSATVRASAVETR